MNLNPIKAKKIKTPYGDKNWSFVKRVFDTHEEMLAQLRHHHIVLHGPICAVPDCEEAALIVRASA